MRTTASLFVITGLSLVLLGCTNSSSNAVSLAAPKGYAAPTAINRPSWEEKLAFQTGTTPADAPPPSLATASKAPARKTVASRTHRARHGVMKAAHRRPVTRRRSEVVAER